MEPLLKANFTACWGLLAMAIFSTCVMEVESADTYGLRSIASGNAFIAQRCLVATVIVSGFIGAPPYSPTLPPLVHSRRICQGLNQGEFRPSTSSQAISLQILTRKSPTQSVWCGTRSCIALS
jgi:hypothetical protein